ncbi:MAG: glutamine synthetase [Proteobacteria bacterium]|nr:glutamine synthetase [Pseudomonadota bacterium]
MTDFNLASIDDVRTLLEARGASHVHVGLTDHTGQLRGKCIRKDKFIGGLEHGLAMTHNLVAVDFTDVIYPVEGLIVGGDGFGDGVASVVLESCREIPWEPPERNLFFLIEHRDAGASRDPRSLCKRQMAKAESLGFVPYLACELEFRLFNETSKSLSEKSYRNLELATPVSNYLGIMRQAEHSELFNALISDMEQMGIPIECAHWELGPGFAELVLQYARGMRAADNAIIYKTFAKAFALRRQMTFSFMARYTDRGDGSSCHLHTSLRGANGETVFHDPTKPDGISETMRHFIGGVQKLLPELLLMQAPNVNSFKRFVPGIFAPVASTWGIDNRTTSLRAIVGAPGSQRVENRVPGADCNPYLAIAATLASGLWGIENEVEPTAMFRTSVYEHMDQVPRELMFPASFAEAITRFRDSEFAKDAFGEEFVRVYSATRAAQDLDYRRAVTDWEIARFLELA